MVKNLPANTGDIRDAGSIHRWGRSPRVEMATHSSILAWRIYGKRIQVATVYRVAESDTTEHAGAPKVRQCNCSDLQRQQEKPWYRYASHHLTMLSAC